MNSNKKWKRMKCLKCGSTRLQVWELEISGMVSVEIRCAHCGAVVDGYGL